VANDKRSQGVTETEKNESVLIVRVVRIVNETGVFIIEDGLSLFEGNAMLADIGPVLTGIPLEPEVVIHHYSIPTL
jgi:hypothetical protein